MVRPSLLRCLFALAAAVLLLPGPDAHAQPGSDLTLEQAISAIDDTLDAETYAGAFWGVRISNLRTGRVLYERNAGHNFVPASNVKLLTSAAALERLGPSFRYRTRVYMDGPVEDGVLKGNLVVRGSGDPTLGHVLDDADDDADPVDVFEAWADSLKARGISRIEGDIVGDDNVFNDTPLGYGWSWDDATYAYSAEIGGLSFNLNKIDLESRGQQPGMPTELSWRPYNTNYVTVVNRSLTIAPSKDDDEEYRRERGTNRIFVDNRVPAGGVETEELAVTNPTLYTTTILHETLLRSGISVGGRPVDLDDAPIQPRYEDDDMRVVATHLSPELPELLRRLNLDSVNLYGENLLRTLAVTNPPDSTGLPERSAELGTRAVQHTLAAAGVDTSRVELADGSGLSRQNFISPRAMGRLLAYMWQHERSDVSTAFYESLPIGGRNGTLEYRFRAGPAGGNVRAKTGTLSNVSALSGYVTTSRGTPLAFSIFCNHYTTDGDNVRDAQDVLVNALARLDR